jgi:hypothetical protein
MDRGSQPAQPVLSEMARIIARVASEFQNAGIGPDATVSDQGVQQLRVDGLLFLFYITSIV